MCARAVGLAFGLVLALNLGTAVAQPSPPSTGIDLSQFVVPPEAIGDGWNITSQYDEPTLFHTSIGPAAVGGYVVDYAQGSLVTANVALYVFSDRVDALAAYGDPDYYWGHGDTVLVPLSGVGDDQSFRAYPVGKGPTSGITFVDGPIVAFVRAEDDGASDTTGVDATCDSLAATADGLLQGKETASAGSPAPIVSALADFGRNHALLEQIGGLHTPFLHRRKVASWANPAIHRSARLLLYRNLDHP